MTSRPGARLAATLLLAGLAAACDDGVPGGGSGSQAVAVWKIDEDANLAYPACAGCGAVLDRGSGTCAACGAEAGIEPKVIPCPECSGGKSCAHCGPSHACVACRGTHVCPICDGSGRWHGEICPECSGDALCPDCGPAAPAVVCEACAGSRVCPNCTGEGTITLR